jgi:hypothetical protein
MPRLPGCVMVAAPVALHPLLSFTVIVYVPALSPLAVRPVPALPLHEYVYGDKPPVAALALALPVPPLQVTLLTEEMLIPRADAGCVMLADAVAVQP